MSRTLPFLKTLGAAALFCSVAAGAQAEGKGLGGLFSRASTKAPATAPIEGPISKACGVRGAALGKVVEKGPGRWRLYDTNPGSTARRAFYLTGFSDGCPRRLEGAVALFGSVDLYEALHYGPVGIKPSQAATDGAYAKLRARVCGSAAKPCSSGQTKRLSRSAIFVNVYDSTGSTRRLELLMTGGRLTASALK